MQNSISKTTIRISGPKFLTDMQHKALGYRTNGHKSVQEVEWEQDSNSVIGKSPRTKWVGYATYSRHVCYPTNFLLGLTAALMIIAKVIRAAFRIDERMDEICRDNGWMLWSEYNNY